MSSEGGRVTVKLRRAGWEVEITCPLNEVQQAIESILAGLDKSGTQPAAEIATPSPGKTTCRGVLQQLWAEGWFQEERALTEVHEELARRGYHYDPTAVSHSLTDLVRELILSRVGSARSYRYVQKKPPA